MAGWWPPWWMKLGAVYGDLTLVLLLNAKHVKMIPGHKTVTTDAGHEVLKCEAPHCMPPTMPGLRLGASEPAYWSSGSVASSVPDTTPPSDSGAPGAAGGVPKLQTSRTRPPGESCQSQT